MLPWKYYLILGHLSAQLDTLEMLLDTWTTWILEKLIDLVLLLRIINLDYSDNSALKRLLGKLGNLSP